MTLALRRPVTEASDGPPLHQAMPHQTMAHQIAASQTMASQMTAVGMPQLGLHGLSEQWLLRDCGHRHWLMLAGLFGLDRPEFRDRDGNKLYATFTGVSVTDARLDRVAEHDLLRFEGRVHPVSRTQYESAQRITVGGRTVAHVRMVSAFLRRAVPDDNRSVQRATPVRPPFDLPAPVIEESLADQTHRFRRGTWDEHAGFRQADRGRMGEVRIAPCPHGDFNGAGFLYFASFQSIVDRCEWTLFGARSASLVTVRRDLFFYGNINMGDTLTVTLRGERRHADDHAHWFEIRRDSDGGRIAEVFTWREVERDVASLAVWGRGAADARDTASDME